MLCIGVGVINRVQNEIMNAPLFWLSIIDAIVSPLQGFLNRYANLEVALNPLSIVYGMNKKLRERWFQTLFCCCFKKEEKTPLLRRNPQAQ